MSRRGQPLHRQPRDPATGEPADIPAQVRARRERYDAAFRRQIDHQAAWDAEKAERRARRAADLRSIE